MMAYRQGETGTPASQTKVILVAVLKPPIGKCDTLLIPLNLLTKH